MFKSYLCCKQITDDEWELTEDLVYDAGRFGVITAKRGFVCDFCSVPRLPIVFLLTGGQYEGAGVIHDYIYRYGGMSREDADTVFYMALRDLGCPPWKAGLMHKAVRLGGKKLWDAYRRKDNG